MQQLDDIAGCYKLFTCASAIEPYNMVGEQAQNVMT